MEHSFFVTVNGLDFCVDCSHLINLLLKKVTKSQLAIAEKGKLAQISVIVTFGSSDFFTLPPDEFTRICPNDFDTDRSKGFWEQRPFTVFAGLVAGLIWQRHWLCFFSSDEMSIFEFVTFTCRLQSFPSPSHPSFSSPASHSLLIWCFGWQKTFSETEALMTEQEFSTKRFFKKINDDSEDFDSINSLSG